MATGWATDLLIVATAINGIGTGATLDQAIKQVPARRHIGALAYASYVRAADLSNGLRWYPTLGISTVVVTATAVVAGLLDSPSMAEAVALILAAIATAGHLFASSRAAPTLLALRAGVPDETTTDQILDRFARFNGARAVGVVVALSALTWALAVQV
jgi:hypothetical protein